MTGVSSCRTMQPGSRFGTRWLECPRARLQVGAWQEGDARCGRRQPVAYLSLVPLSRLISIGSPRGDKENAGSRPFWAESAEPAVRIRSAPATRPSLQVLSQIGPKKSPPLRLILHMNRNRTARADDLRLKIISCWRRTMFSASSLACDLNRYRKTSRNQFRNATTARSSSTPASFRHTR